MMWPFKRKKKTLITTTGLLAELLQQKLPMAHKCPEMQFLAKVCTCIDCPKVNTCVMEEACRKTGCEHIIRACSLKTALMEKEGKVSDFADIVSSILTRKMLQDFGREKDYQEARKSMMEKRTEEDANAKKEVGSEGTLSGEGPTSNM